MRLPRTDGKKPRRNDPCPCGSGRKYKVCCGSPGAATRAPSVTTARAPSSPGAARELAQHLLKTGQYAAAIEPLTEAARLTPQNPSLLADLGTACLLAGRAPEAVAWLRRSLALRSTFGGTHYNLGLALEQTGDSEAALACHERAIALSPELTPAYGKVVALSLAQKKPEQAAKATTSLGILLAEAGRFDEASKSFERAIELDPCQAIAHHGIVTSRRLGEPDRPLLAQITAQLASSDLTDSARMTLHFAAGKALEDLTDPAGAMEHFEAANRLRKSLSRPFDAAELERRVDQLIARFTPELFAGSKPSADTREADDELPILVLGMPRSGTTLVERILGAHPAVASGGELVFWNARAPAWLDGKATSAESLRADYVALLRGIDPKALRVTDKMPFNFLWVGLVHLAFPKARIVLCNRSPVDTCLSIYTTLFAQSWGFASDRRDLVAYFRQYERLVAHWRAVLPPDRWLEVDYEEATRAPEEVARRLVAFAGLPWDAACLRPEESRGPVKTASKWQARQPIYRSSVERWRKFEPWLGELRGLVPPDS